MLPAIVWFTGLPSSGKSSLARRVRERLLADGHTPALLDGDELRPVLVPGGGYDEESRALFYAALVRLAEILVRQGHVVLVAATAHRRAFRDAARATGARMLEVFVDPGVDEVRERDAQKGLWASIASATLPGRDVPYEAPTSPDVRATGADDDAVLAAIVALLQQPARGPLEECYVALRVEPTAEVVRAHEACAREHGLVPRPELHVTLVYLGTLESAAIESLRTILAPIVAAHGVPRRLSIAGLGAALRDADGAELDATSLSLRRTDVRKVVWWAVAPGHELTALSGAIVGAIRRAGHHVPAPSSPHVTVGSNAASMLEAFFDVHGIPKNAFRTSGAPAEVLIDRLHVTDTTVHPESLVVLGEPGRE